MGFMIEFIISVISSGVLSAGLTLCMIFLTKSIISERLKNAIKSEYEEKLETHRAQLKAASDIEIEKLKSYLSISAAEHQIKFGRLHEKRAEVIAELYTFIVRTHWVAYQLILTLSFIAGPKKSENYLSFLKSILELFQYFEINKIYLPEGVCQNIGGFISEVFNRANVYTYLSNLDASKISEQQMQEVESKINESWSYFHTNLPSARMALEAEMRGILGS